MINSKQNYLCLIEILYDLIVCKKMSSSSFKNTINKVCLQIIFNMYV